MKTAFRSILRRPVFTFTTVLILAFGIGANSALFSVVNAVLLSPMPYLEANRLVQILDGRPDKNQRESLIAPQRLADWNRLGKSFDGISGTYTENVTDTSMTEPERLLGKRVAPGYFEVFRAPPILGRTLLPAEEGFGSPPAAVISEGLWTRRYGRDPQVTSRRLLLSGSSYRIVGVMPKEFAPSTIDVWMPAQFNPWMMGTKEARQYTRFIVGAGRLKPGVTLRQAQADLERVSRRLGEMYPESDKGWSPVLTGYKEAWVGADSGSLFLVFGSAGMLLLILCANIAGLLLGQVQKRERELAIRAALGATRRQIAGVVLREVSILAAASGAMGLALAAFAGQLMGRLFVDLPRMQEMRFDCKTALFTVAITVLTAAVFGLLPAVQATRRSLRASVQESGRSLAVGNRRMQQVLVGTQFTVTLVLLAGAGLLLRSYQNLTAVRPGFHAGNVTTFHLGAEWGEDRAQIGAIQQRLIEALEKSPGILSAGASNFLPASGASLREQVAVQAETPITTGTRNVTAGYLQALGIPLLRGSSCPDFRAGRQSPVKVLVNRRFAEVAGVANLVGHQLTWKSGNGRPAEIAGVVGDVREDALNAPVVPYVYQCLQPGDWPDPEYVVSASGNPSEVMETIRRTAHEVAPRRAVFCAMPLSDYLDETLDRPRLNAELLAVFAASALLSAALGLYGLVMLTVTARTKELGIRIALGAPASRILSSAVGEAVRPLIFAAFAGVMLAYPALRAFRSLFFEVSPTDGLTLLAVGALLVAVAAVAAIVPGRRAVRIDPIEALRVE